MDNKPKNREWVKNAAIVFLAVLLVLTFFSNTWMNRSLPEVATQSVTDGSITAKVRGTGTVVANGTHQVKAEKTREIRAVMIKAGQEVAAGDVLFILGDGSNEEIEAAQEALRALQVSYQRTAAGIPNYSYELEEMEIENAERAWVEAERALEAVKNSSKRDLPYEQEAAAQAELEAAKAVVKDAEKKVADQKIIRDTYQESYNLIVAEAQAKVDGAQEALAEKNAEVQILSEKLKTCQQTLAEAETRLQELKDKMASQTEDTPQDEQVTQEEVDAAQAAVDEARADTDTTQAALNTALAEQNSALDEFNSEQTAMAAISREALAEQEEKLAQAEAVLAEAKMEQEAAQSKLEAIEAVIDEIVGNDVVSEEYKRAKAVRDEAEKSYYTLIYNLEQKKESDAKSQALSYIDLSDLNSQIERARQKLNELTGGEENQITANVSGTVQSVECTSGDTKLKDDVLCTIEVPDMGYTLSFSVSNEQARRLRPGDTATVSNYYWGNQITATLNTIQVDPKMPQTNKLLTFDVDGDVNTGAELTLSVGQKSANYDTVIPNSAIRSDANGSFVLAIEARNSPLGNRYIARRVNVEMLASDDVNSAVTAELGYGDYVITTSNAPVKNGDMVRLADA